MQFFLNTQLFKLRLPSVKNQYGNETPDRKSLISVSDILAHDEFLAFSRQFEMQLSNNQLKRIFSISKQHITLSMQNCQLLLLHEETAFFQLEKERDLMKGIRFANSCVTNQIIAPLEMINQYVDILVSKSQPRPDI
jgi:hypothetical protein